MTDLPRLADLYCGAGGSAVGLHQVGFQVIGFDLQPQPRYPFEFHQLDALQVSLEGFDAVWASPPCQKYTRMLLPSQRTTHIDLVAPTRDLLAASGLPYIIENVVGAPLKDTILLCGQMFGLRVFRHRLFESNVFLWAPPHQRHQGHTSTGSLAAYHTFEKGSRITVAGHAFRLRDGAAAMGIDWMNRAELAQAVPPCYSEFLGRQLVTTVLAAS